MKPLVSLRFALGHAGLLGRALPGPTWFAWRVTLLAAMGEALTADELATFRELSGRSTPPSKPVDEMAAVVGRRGGKSRALSTFAIFLAALCDHSNKLVSGERGVVLLIAPNQKQARINLSYIAGLLAESPELKSMVVNQTADVVTLSNGIDIEVRAANFRQLRGVTCIAVLADETAFLADDGGGSANPDVEILNAVRPSLATTGGPLMIASSPYRKAGALWDIYREHYGPDGDSGILVVKGTSRHFNPSLDQRIIDRALARDRAAASAEYLAEFRADLENYVPLDVVEACVEHGIFERAPSTSHRYFAFSDPAGGSGQDSMTLAIAHKEADTIVLDAVREARPPFSPADTIAEHAKLLRAYRVREVTGDRYAGEFPRELFAQHGIKYRLAELNKSEIYIECLPRLNSKSVRLLHSDRLVRQIASLERRHGRTGRDVIDHPPRAHDDLANSAMGVCLVAAKPLIEVRVGAIDTLGRVSFPDQRTPRDWIKRYRDEDGNEVDRPPRILA